MQQFAQRVGSGDELVPVELYRRDRIGQARGVWLTAADAAIYVGCRSTRAFYTWRKVKGLVPNGRGFYARRDLDRALAIPRKRHQMHPSSLANLRVKR
jgi:hypothetical protein